jgi:hypothetical protein
MSPWIDRKILIKNAESFVASHGYFLRQNGPRISSLVEIAIYNSIVQFFKARGFQVRGENLGPKSSFRYKLTAAGLTENYSYFVATKDDIAFHILHNMRMQSAHHDHLYFTGDVVVADESGATTQKLKNGRRHSFVAKEHLVTFAEVKHLNPFPEVLFNFMGLVLEFMPTFVNKINTISKSGDRLCPVIAFTGAASDHSELIQQSLSERYGINIVFSTSSTFGSLADFDELNKYASPVARAEAATETFSRKFDFTV